MTQNGHSWPQMALKHFPWVYLLHDSMSCWTTLGPFQRPMGAPKWSKTAPKWPFMTQNGHSWPKMALQWRNFMTQNIPSWPKMSLHDPKWPLNISQGHNTWLYSILGHPGAFSEANVAPGWSNMTQYHVVYPGEVFLGYLGSCKDIWGHIGPFWWNFWPSWWCFGPFWVPRGPLKRAQGGPKWHIIM